MPLTANEIRDRAANACGVLRLGQALQDQDRVRFEQGYAEVYADLEIDQLAAFLSTSVPDEVATDVSMLVALNCASDYGVSNDRFQRIVARVGINGELGKRNIRKAINPWQASNEGVSDY